MTAEAQEQIRQFVCELSYIVLDNETAAFNLLNIYVYAGKKIQNTGNNNLISIPKYIIYNFIQKYWDACTDLRAKRLIKSQTNIYFLG